MRVKMEDEMHKHERVMKEWRGEIARYWRTAKIEDILIDACQYIIHWEIGVFLFFCIVEL